MNRCGPRTIRGQGSRPDASKDPQYDGLSAGIPTTFIAGVDVGNGPNPSAGSDFPNPADRAERTGMRMARYRSAAASSARARRKNWSEPTTLPCLRLDLSSMPKKTRGGKGSQFPPRLRRSPSAEKAWQRRDLFFLRRTHRWKDGLPRLARPQSLSQTSSPVHRQRGTRIGLAVGNALGAAVEFERPGMFGPVTGNRDVGRSMAYTIRRLRTWI